MTKFELLNTSMAMMDEKGELFANHAYGRARDYLRYYPDDARRLTRMVIRLVRVFAYGRQRGIV
jgi:hypothetical protein